MTDLRVTKCMNKICFEGIYNGSLWEKWEKELRVSALKRTSLFGVFLVLIQDLKYISTHWYPLQISHRELAKSQGSM